MAEADARGTTRDFGGLVSHSPSLVVHPSSTAEVAALIRDAVAGDSPEVVACGCRHSSRGESLTDGIALDMRGMVTVHQVSEHRVVVHAGATWREVLEATLSCGRVPPVLTDYLDLTVGGTLSAAGIGGASHVHGTQAANVLELESVTPEGEIVTCSPRHQSQLFDALRSGMGRYGVITKATLRLIAAPESVLSCRVRYASAAELIAAQGRIVADHISGQVKSSGFELKAVVYDASGPPQGLTPLDVEELRFEDFADRMRPDVERLVELGEWDRPHPWGRSPRYRTREVAATPVRGHPALNSAARQCHPRHHHHHTARRQRPRHRPRGHDCRRHHHHDNRNAWSTTGRVCCRCCTCPRGGSNRQPWCGVFCSSL